VRDLSSDRLVQLVRRLAARSVPAKSSSNWTIPRRSRFSLSLSLCGCVDAASYFLGSSFASVLAFFFFFFLIVHDYWPPSSFFL
jgi:hypothetical protein